MISQIFPDYNHTKQETNNRRKAGQLINTWKLKNTFLNKQWFKE